MSVDRVRADEPEAALRPARRQDARAIATVHVASWQSAYRGLLTDEYLASHSVAMRTDQWEVLLAGPEADQVIVAVAGARVVGFAQVGPCRDADAPPRTGELVTLYLHPEVWDRGLGRHLQEEALRRLTRDGYRSARLWMLSTNDRARRFYLRQGWSLLDGRRIQELGGQVVVDHRFGRPLAPQGPQIFSRPSQ